MSDTLADILPDLSPVRKRNGEPTLHRDGTVSWQAGGDWRRTSPEGIPPLVLAYMTPGRVKNLLISKHQEARA